MGKMRGPKEHGLLGPKVRGRGGTGLEFDPPRLLDFSAPHAHNLCSLSTNSASILTYSG